MTTTGDTPAMSWIQWALTRITHLALTALLNWVLDRVLPTSTTCSCATT